MIQDSAATAAEVGPPDPAVYASLLKICGERGAIAEGRRVHASIVKLGLDRDMLLSNTIIQMYGNCGCIQDCLEVYGRMADKNVYTETIMLVAFAQNGHLQEARNLFESMRERTSVSWNAMISAYAQHGHCEISLKLFRLMQQDGSCKPNKSTFVNILGACSELIALRSGKLVHENVCESGVESDFMVGTALVNMYGKCGSLNSASHLFNRMPQRTLVTWTVMLTAFSQNGHLQESKRLFDKFPQWSLPTLNSMVSTFVENRRLREARELFERMQEHDGTSWNLMIAAHAEDGQLGKAHQFFTEMPHRCVISWTTMLSAHSQSSDLITAREFFTRMPQHDSVAWNAMISALGRNNEFREAEALFENLPVKNAASWSSMMVAYAQNGGIEEAKKLFDRMQHPGLGSWGAMFLTFAQRRCMGEARSLFEKLPHKSVFVWNSMISACSKGEREHEALEVFSALESEPGLEPNEQTFVSVLEACGRLGALADGKALHAKLIKLGLEDSSLVATSLIEMYGKCGSMECARSVFDKLEVRELLSWNAMISAYGQNGNGSEATELFRRMQAEGSEADRTTFMSLLAACSHDGMVKQGVEVFHIMVEDFEIESLAEHYLCLIDLLGRAGSLEMAEELLVSMPFEADSVAWKSLLSACGEQADQSRGTGAARMISGIDSNDSAWYSLLSNLIFRKPYQQRMY